MNLKSIRLRRLFTIMLVVILGFTLTACGEKSDKVEEPEDELVDGEKKDDHYPVTITTYGYDKEPIELTFDKAPEKVVAVYQNSIETLLALGLEDSIVAASGLDHDVKDEFRYQFETIDYYENIPSKEEVVGLEPDFILSWYSLFGDKMLGDVDFWHDRGTKTYIAQNSGLAEFDSLENEYEDILNIGKIFNKEEEAKKLVEDMKLQMEEAQEHIDQEEKVKAVIIEVGKDNMYRVYGEDSIGGNIATGVGADLVADENGSIGSEDLVALNPDVIFTVYYGDEIQRDDSLLSIIDNEALSSITAVKDKRVHPIMLSEVYASGIRTMDGINSIIDGLYPEMNE